MERASDAGDPQSGNQGKKVLAVWRATVISAFVIRSATFLGKVKSSTDRVSC